MIPSGPFDVIVVGAGPAGSTAARFAAAGGVRVLLLDRKRDLGAPVRCGEGVSTAGLRPFIEPDPRWIAAEISGARLYAPGGAYLEVEDLGAGLILERKIFDRELVNLAVREGVEVATEAAAIGLVRNDEGAVAGVRVRHFGEEMVISGKVVIGADGVDARVGRWAGLRTDVKLADMETCAQYLVANCRTEKNYCEFYLGRHVAPGGYAWIFPKGDGKANVGIGVSANHTRQRGSAREHLDRFMARVVPDGKIIGFMIGGVPVATTLRSIVADGVMLAGDAARQVNPLTGGGIVSAMIAGRLAGEVAAKAIVKTGDWSRVGLAEYERRWSRGVGRDFRRNYRLKEAVSRLTDETLDRTAEAFMKAGERSTSLFRIFAHIFARHPKLLWEIRHVFLAGVG